MTIPPRLFRSLIKAAITFEAARVAVLRDWAPECGCTDIGKLPQCETCPHRAVYRDLVRAKILELSEEEQHG